MEYVTKNPRYGWVNLACIVLLFPAFYVILISLLKYGLGINGPFDASQPFLENLGIKEPPGFWNISLLLLVGPPIAFILALLQLLHFEWKSTWQRLDLSIVVFWKRIPLIIVLLSGLTILTLSFYLFVENCNCH